METISSADGTTIAYERTGSGPPLVLVHGATADHTTWDDARPSLDAEFTVYAMDRRGRGESGDVPPYSLDGEVEDVLAVVEAVGQPIVLLGHSFGGLCVLEAALRSADLRGLVVYEPEVVADATPDDGRALATIRHEIEAGDRDGALVTFYREFAGLTESELDYLRNQPTWSRRVDAVDTALRETAVAFDYEFDPARFRALETPTLLLVGGESSDLAHEEADLFHETIPESRIGVLEGQQHLGYRTAPAQFADVVSTFVRALE